MRLWNSLLVKRIWLVWVLCELLVVVVVVVVMIVNKDRASSSRRC